MTRKQDTVKKTNWKGLMAGQEDFLRPLLRKIVQQVLEARMDEAIGAGKGERTPNRQGYRSGHYGRTLVTRVGKLELRVPQGRQGRFRTDVFARQLPIQMELIDDGVKMRQRWTGKEIVPKQTQSVCQRCGAWSSAERCPQCGAHKLSTEFSRGRIEDQPKTATAGR